MTRALTLLFAVAGGAAVGNLYWAQPPLDFIARDLHASAATAGRLITASPIGYAVGILLIVPLGDVRDRRQLIPVMMLCSAAALTLCALAPSMGVLLFAVTLLGLTTDGWTAVTIAGAALSVFALTVWAVGRRSALVVGKPPHGVLPQRGGRQLTHDLRPVEQGR